MANRLVSLVVLGFLTMACVRTVEETVASRNRCPGFAKNTSGQKLIWTSQFPIRLNIDANFPAPYRVAITSAISAWNTKMNYTIFVLEGENPASAPVADGKNIIYWATEWKEAADKQAHSYIRWNNDQISEADMLINGQDFAYSVARPVPGLYDLNSIVTHELGHFLGLDHSNSQGSIMRKFFAEGSFTEISDVDVASVKCAYGAVIKD